MFLTVLEVSVHDPFGLIAFGRVWRQHIPAEVCGVAKLLTLGLACERERFH
jgi:hypothetical protein